MNTAAYIASHGQARVLLVDMDPQGQAGKSLGFYVRDMYPTVYDLMVDPLLDPQEAIRPSHVDGLDMLVSNKDLAEFPTEVAND